MHMRYTMKIKHIQDIEKSQQELNRQYDIFETYHSKVQ